MTAHFLTGEELSAQQLSALLDRAAELKLTRETATRSLAGKTVALIFEKPSTRTRFSAETGVFELGAHPLVVSGADMQLSRGESLRDTALVLSRYVHAIGIRTGPHETVEELAKYSEVPIVNMLTADHHPCQALADLLTLRQRFGKTEGLKLAYVGDGNNVANSLMLLGAIAGVEVAVATPPELAPDAAIVARAQALGSVTVTTDVSAAADGANALYTDVWVSMSDSADEADRRRLLLDGFRLDEALIGAAADDAIVLHCLPAHVGEEITESALYGERSAVFDQAENRLHAQKALFEQLMTGG